MNESRFAGQSFEQLQEQSQRSYQDVRQAISNTASAVTRYAQYIRPTVNPAELLVVVDTALQQCLEETLQRIEPTSGKIRQPNWQAISGAARRQQQQVRGGGGGGVSAKAVRRALMTLAGSSTPGGGNR